VYPTHFSNTRATPSVAHPDVANVSYFSVPFFRAAGYFNRWNEVILHRGRVARHYARKWLVLDAFASLPYSLLFYFLPNNVPVGVFVWLRLLLFMRLPRAFRYLHKCVAGGRMPETRILLIAAK
jgi:hypothetical protein